MIELSDFIPIEFSTYVACFEARCRLHESIDEMCEKAKQEDNAFAKSVCDERGWKKKMTVFVPVAMAGGFGLIEQADITAAAAVLNIDQGNQGARS